MKNTIEWRTDKPPIGKAVLVTIEALDGRRETETGIMSYDEEKPWYIYERSGYLRTGKVIAWAEMPEPYKGDDEQ